MMAALQCESLCVHILVLHNYPSMYKTLQHSIAKKKMEKIKKTIIVKIPIR